MAVRRNARGQRIVNMDEIREILTAQQYVSNLSNTNTAPVSSGASLDVPVATKSAARNLPQISGGVKKIGGDEAATIVKQIANTPDATAGQMRRQALNAANSDNVEASRMQTLTDDQRRQRAAEQIQRPRVAAQQAAATSADDKRRAAYEQERARQQAERNRVQYDPNSQYADIYERYADLQENENTNAVSTAMKSDFMPTQQRNDLLAERQYYERLLGMAAAGQPIDTQDLNIARSRIAYIDNLLGEDGRLQVAYNERIRSEEYTRDEAHAAQFEKVQRNEDFESLAKYAMTDREGYNPFVDNPAFYAVKMIAETGEVPDGSGSAYLYMTDDEAKTYSYYIAQGDRVKADDYFSSIKHRLNERMANAQYVNLYEWADDHPWLAAAASVGANLGSFSGYFAGIGQNIENMITGIDRPIDTNSSAFLPTRATQIMREGVTADMGKTGSFLTNTGLSLADMAANFLMYGPAGSVGVEAGLFGSAAGTATYEAAERGLSAGQATAIGTAAGAAEILAEKLPVDNLFKLAEGPVSLISKEGVKEILKQAGIEFTEEALTEYANTLTDIAVAGNQSQYAQYVQQLVASGMSPEDAEHQANIQFFIVQPAEAGAAGAVSGGVMGGGAIAIGGGLVSPRVQQALESATPEQAAALSLESQPGRTQTEDVALSVLEGTVPKQQDIVDIRKTPAMRREFEALTGVSLEGDISTVTARVTAAAKKNEGNADFVNAVTQMAAEDAQAAQEQAAPTSAIASALQTAADTQSGAIEQAQPESVYAPAQQTAPSTGGFFSRYLPDNTVPGGENAVGNALEAAANTLNEGQIYTVGEGNNYSNADMSTAQRTALNRAETALSGLGISADISARTADEVYTQTAAQLAEYVDEHSGFAELKQYADESGVPVEELIRTALKENKVTVGGEAGVQLDRLVPGDLDSTRNKLAEAKADLDYALARKHEYGNVRYGGTRKTREQFEKWSAEVRRAQQEVARLENELKAERGGEIRYLAKKSTTDGALPENTPTSDDIQALRDIAAEHKAKGETTRVNINDFTSDDVRRTEVWARRFWAQLKEKSPFFRAWFGDWRAYDTKHKVSVVKKVPRTIGAELTVQEVAKKVREKYKSGDLFRGNVKNNDTGFVINVGAHGHNDTTTYAQRELRKKDVTKEEFLRRVNLLNSIQDLIKNSILLDTEIIDDPDNPNRSFMHTFYAIAEIDGYVEIVKLKVDEVEDSKNPTKRFYNLNDIQINNPSAVNWDSNPSTDADGMSDNLPDKLSIADLHTLVKKYDPEFTPRPVNPAFLNEAGTPKIYYHGTPNGTFTEFREWQYFTENKEYADVYQNQGASSNGYKPTAAAPTTYAVYLTGEKVFDTRNEAERTIFEQEFYRKWGNGAPLSDKGLPDWTDGDDLIDFFEEKGYDYDTILLDEGGTGGYGDEVKSRGISVVVRDANQIKSATGNIGTFDSGSNDIRYLAAKPRSAADIVKALDKGQYAQSTLNSLAAQVRSYMPDFTFDSSASLARQRAQLSGAISAIAKTNPKAEFTPGAKSTTKNTPQKKPPAEYVPGETLEIDTRINGRKRTLILRRVDPLDYARQHEDAGRIEESRAIVRSYNSVRKIAKAFGLKVVFTDGSIKGSPDLDGFSGFWVNGTIYLNAKKMTSGDTYVLWHELGHEIASKDPDILQDFYNLCMDYARANGTIAEFEAKLNDIYRNWTYATDTEHGLFEEVFANTLADMAKDESFAKYAVGTKPTLWERIIDAITTFIQRLRDKGLRRQARMFDAQRAVMLDALDRYRQDRGGEGVVPERVRRRAEAERAHARSLDDQFIMRNARQAEPADVSGTAASEISENILSVSRRTPHEVTDYGYKHITVSGKNYTVFVVNPNMQAKQKKFSKLYSTTIDAARSLAGSLGYRIGFVVGDAINETTRKTQYESVTRIPDAMLADDGVIYINLNSKHPYPAIVGAMFWEKLKLEHPKVSREVMRQMRRLKTLDAAAFEDRTPDNLARNLVNAQWNNGRIRGHNISTKGVHNGAAAIISNPVDILEVLSTNRDAAQALSREAPSLARKILDVVGDLLATSDEKRHKRISRVIAQAQARILYEVSKQADVARQTEPGSFVPKSGPGRSAPGGVRFLSLQTTPDGTKYVDVDVDVDQERFDGLAPVEMQKEARQIIKDRFKGKVIGTNNNRAYVNKRSAEEYAYPAKRIDDVVKESKMRASTELDNLMSASVFIGNEIDDGHHPEAVNGWRKYSTIFRVNARYWRGVISVMGTQNGWVFHDVTKIEDVTEGISGLPDERSSAASDGNVSDDSIPRFLAKVNQTLPEHDPSQLPLSDIISALEDRMYTREQLEDIARQVNFIPEDGVSIEELSDELADILDEMDEMGTLPDRFDSGDSTSADKAETTVAEPVVNKQQKSATAPPRLTESLFRKQYMLGMREGRAEVRDTYKRRDLRDGIKGRVKKINKALLTPTDISHVPERLQGAIANFLKEFTGDTSVFTRTQLVYLKDAYSRINEAAEDAEYGVSYAYDPEIANMIGELADTIDGRRLSELSYEETQKVSDIVKHFQHLVRDENKIEIQGKRERVEKLGLSIMRDMDKLPAAGDSRLRGSAKAFADMLASDNITPAYFFKRLGGTVETLFKSMRDGQNVWARRMDSARKTYEDIYKRHHAKAWLDKKGDVLEMKTERDEDIRLTRQQALTLYATWKREVTNRVQDAGHLSMGGFVYENAVSRKRGQVSVDTTRAHPLSANDMGKIMAWLTDEQRAFADELVAYMSGELAQYGNEASVQLHGWEKFNEKYYFPYNSAENYLFSQSAVADDRRLKHMSFTKMTTRKANNPIILSDFTSVWANHVQSMMLYSSIAVPLENFNRVFNFRTPASETATSSSVKESIERAYGKRAKLYIKQLMKDINGGVQSNPSEGLLNSLLSKFKKSAVFASASVAVQQPSSIVRAMAMVDPKYFVPTTTPMRSYEECMKYCGTAIIKRMGRFDTNTGRGAAEWLIARPYEKISEKAAAVVTDSSYRDEVMSAAASKADEIAWGFLWNAVKREQVKEHGYKPGSPELFKAAAERFDEVVNFTQVYDSVFARSQMMRSQGLGAKITTNFMSEPTVAYNMLFDAFANAKRTDIANKVSPQRAVAAFVATGLVNALLKSIVTAARDDDEDKTYWEKYLGKVAGNFADSVNLLNLVPLARDISSLLQGYSVDNPFFELPERTVKAAQNMFEWLSGNSNKSGGDVAWPLVEAIADWFGVPLKNMRRDIKALFNVFKPGDTETNWTGILDSALDALPLYDNTNSRNYERLFDAYENENEQRMEQLVGILAENGVSESSIESGVRSVCRDKYVAGSVTQAEAEEFLTEFCGQTEDEAYWTIVSWDYRAEHPDYSGTWSDYTLLYDAIDEGDRRTIQQEIDRLLEHGKETRNIKATITRKYGTGYLDDYDLG